MNKKKMKKMTNEEKAKAYDEALDRCKEWASGTCGQSVNNSPKDVAEFIFPQLAESEDEKIRKGLVNFILYKAGHLLDEETEHKFIAYLEKQKEQKQAEKQNYSGLNDLERAILRGFLAAGVDNVPVGIIKETAKECLEQMGLQDPAHENDFVSKVWNKEDEEIMTDIIESLEYAYPYDNEIRNAWLKSLPERFNLQPKQEWSKEDEEMRDTCIYLLEHFPRPCGEVIGPWKDCIAWLKSLRSHKNSPIMVDADQLLKILPPPSWKPSEEQIDALNEIINTLAASKHPHESDYLFNILNGLRKNLKKL